jgi:hypothetical protein
MIAIASAISTALAIVLTACGGSSGWDRNGSSLAAEGYQDALTFFITHPRVGHVYRFAFPQLRNVGKKPVTLIEPRMDSVWKGLTVLGFPTYSLNDVGGRYLVDFDEADEPYLNQLRNHAVRSIVIRPGQLSPFIIMVRVRFDRGKIGRTVPSLRGCDIAYMSSGIRYRQKFVCNFEIGKRAP